MTDLLIFICILVAATVIPVMIAAKLLGAENNGFKACLLAVIGSTVAMHVSNTIISNPGYAAVAGIAFTGVFVSLALGTHYTKAIVISLLAFGIQFVLVAGMAGIGISAGVVDVST